MFCIVLVCLVFYDLLVIVLVFGSIVIIVKLTVWLNGVWVGLKCR